MAPSHFIELAREEKRQLLATARSSIQHGLTTHQPLIIEPSLLAGTLAQELGNFVTLTQDGILRGCIGSIKATHCLAQSVAFNAFNAAFHDSRFSPLSAAEAAQTHIEISVLSKPEPIDASTCEELLSNLHPYDDGLILEEDGHQATFLPKVWEQLPDPQQFVQQLLAKAGLPGDYWSDTLRFHRYQTISFAEQPVNPAVSV
jgi:AmmeMemoRadiSam system protein A